MALDNLKEGLPEYAKDLKLNLDTLSRSTELSEQQLWGTFLATAAATRNDTIISEIAEEASQHFPMSMSTPPMAQHRLWP